MAPNPSMVDVYRNKFYFPARYAPPGCGYNNGQFELAKGVGLTSLGGQSFYYMNATHGVAARLTSASLPITDKGLELIAHLIQEMKNFPWVTDAIAHYKQKKNWVNIDWLKPGIKPYLHQIEDISIMMNVPSTMLDLDCGLGKTFIAIAYLAGMKLKHKHFKALILCPKLLIQNAWIEDIEKFSNLSYFNMRKQRSAKIDGKRKMVYLDVPDDRDVYIMNYDIVPQRLNELKAMDFDALIFDESSKLKNRKGIRAGKIKELVQHIPNKFLLTGSPMPNGIKDLWNQFYLIDNGVTLSNSYSEFESDTHKAINLKSKSQKGYDKIMQVETLAGRARVQARIAPRIIRHRIEDITDIDFPAKQRIMLYTELAPEQKRAYDDIRDELVTWLDTGETVTAANRLVELSKLAQITGGFVTIDRKIKIGSKWKGDLHRFKENPKLDMLIEHLEGIRSSVIVWAWYRNEVEMISKALGLRKFIHGGVTDRRAQSALSAFKTGKDRILVANPASIGHGHTLLAGNYATFFSNSFDWEYRQQAEGRIRRIGQERSICFYHDILARKTIDERIYKSIMKKENSQNFVMDGLLDS